MTAIPVSYNNWFQFGCRKASISAADYAGKEREMPQTEKIPINALIETICAWKGCNRTAFIGDTLPAGWKYIIVVPGFLLRKQNLLNADVDGVLCPEHFMELHGLLKIGQSPK